MEITDCTRRSFRKERTSYVEVLSALDTSLVFIREVVLDIEIDRIM